MFGRQEHPQFLDFGVDDGQAGNNPKERFADQQEGEDATSAAFTQFQMAICLWSHRTHLLLQPVDHDRL
jgi:hypothetical protein